ncbi:PfkB family carbohydrate kinase [Streptomyces sp. NPDC015032]|uniref:PfkB family carbohydrate kinase n=1 Tax=Streptomyces sp. NPDC015032 TaxID=3364937 RepID=UPI0036FB4A39
MPVTTGALWAAASGTVVHEPTTTVEPVDRTGGGDAFNAGVIAGRLFGEPPPACLRRGLDAALHVITKIGAHPWPGGLVSRCFRARTTRARRSGCRRTWEATVPCGLC